MDGRRYLFHQPLGSGGGAADAYGGGFGQQRAVYFLGAVYQVRVGVHLLAFAEQHLAVGAFLAADEEYQVVRGGKLADVGDAVGYLPADGVVVFEGGLGRDVLLDVLHDAAEFVQRLGGLRVEADATGQVERAGFVQFLDDDGLAFGLADEAQHFGVSVLAVDDNLCVFVVLPGVFLLDSLLQAEDDRAGGVDDFDVVAAGCLVGLGRFAVGAQQYLGIVQAVELVVVDGDESHGLQTLHFAAVVHNVAQAVQRAAFGQFLFGFADGVDHSEAEARSFVYFYFSHVIKRCFMGWKTLLSRLESNALPVGKEGGSFAGHAFELLGQPGFLLLDGQVAVVQQQGVVGLAQGAHVAVLVDVVALLHVRQNLVEVHGLSLGLEFVVAALGAYFGRGGDEYLQFGMGKDGGADVASVHDDALGLSHLLLLLYHGFAHEVEGGYGAHLGGYFHGAYPFFHVHAVQVGVRPAGSGVGSEGDVDIVYLMAELVRVDAAVVQQSVLDAIQGDGPVHGSAVDVDVPDFACQVFGHGALAARRESVDGNDYLSHRFLYINKVVSSSKCNVSAGETEHFIFCSKKHAKDKAIFKISRYICSTKAKVAF